MTNNNNNKNQSSHFPFVISNKQWIEMSFELKEEGEKTLSPNSIFIFRSIEILFWVKLLTTSKCSTKLSAIWLICCWMDLINFHCIEIYIIYGNRLHHLYTKNWWNLEINCVWSSYWNIFVFVFFGRG